MCAVAEDVERGPAEDAHATHEGEGRAHPGAKTLFSRAAGGFVAAREEGRRQIVAQFEVALEILRQTGAEGRVGEEAADFVFILVRHQLGCDLCDGARESAVRARKLRLGGFGLGDEGTVFPGPAVAAPGAQAGHAVGQQVAQRVRDADFLVATQPEGYQVGAGGGDAAEAEGALVHGDLRAVQHDGLHDVFHAQRDEAFLPGVADQEQIRADGVAEHDAGDLGRVDFHDAFGVRARPDLFQHRAEAEVEIGIFGK